MSAAQQRRIEAERAYMRAAAWSPSRATLRPELVRNPLCRRVVEAAQALQQRGEDYDAPAVLRTMGATHEEWLALEEMGLTGGLPADIDEALADLIDATDATDGWASFDPIDAAPRAHPFPVEHLPLWVGEMVEAVAKSTGFSADMAAGFALSALSAAIGGRLRVEPWPGWQEPANLYLAVVAPPSEGKSVVFRPLMAPLFDHDQQLVQEHGERVAADTHLRQVSEQRLKSAKEALARTTDGSERLALETDVRQLAAELERPPPVVPRLIAGDVTPEVCAVLLSRHEERLAILSPEDTLFGHLGGRHMSSSKATPAIEVFLSAYSCEPVRVDRLSRGPICLRAPTLTIGVAMQPSVLEGQGSKLADARGLLARFLFVRPQRVVGYRDLSIDLPAIPDDVRQRYAAKLGALVKLGFITSADAPRVLPLSNDARVEWKKWRTSFEPRRSDAGDLATIGAWAGKAEGHALRIAGLIAISEGNEEVDAGTLRRALSILEALVSHAKAAIGLSQLDDAQRMAARLLGWIRRRAEGGGLLGVRPGLLGVPHMVFTERDATKENRTWLTRDGAASALRNLSERGYIRRVQHTGMGRPSARWEVHTGRLLGAFGSETERTFLDPSSSSFSPRPSTSDKHPEAPKTLGRVA